MAHTIIFGGTGYIGRNWAIRLAAQDKFKRAADDLYPHNTLYGKNDPADEDQYHYCVFVVDHARLSFRMMKLVANGSSVTSQPRDGFEIPAN